MIPPAPTASVDVSGLRSALAEYAKLSKSSLATIINRKSLHIVRRARHDAPEARKYRILTFANASQQVRVSKKTGKVRRKTMFSGKMPPHLFAVYRWGLKQRGKPNTGKVSYESIRKMVGHRLSAVGTVRRGWTAAIARFSQVLDGLKEGGGGRMKQRGYAKPAKEGWNPVAEAAYQVTIQSRKSPKIHPRVVAALQNAMNIETAQTVAEVQRRMAVNAGKAESVRPPLRLALRK